ncbi:hypothetical protein MSPP1_001160 [Malassezia sp. CBS 17886]|nr:hypothetical protein MSPP1_001160 [Malassezia sp. CBS 17886]
MSAKSMQSTNKRPRPNSDPWRFNKNIHPFLRLLASVMPPTPDEVPRISDDTKVPFYSELNQAMYVVPWAFMPFFMRLIWHGLGYEMPSRWVMWGMLVFFEMCFVLSWIAKLNALVRAHGYLDQEVPRDTVPDASARQVLFEAMAALFFRPSLAVFLSYNSAAAPKLTFWLPVQLCVFTLAEDFYYYWLHRACHEMDDMWAYHRLHHTTKHPTSLLLGFADEMQECFDIIIVPMMAYFTFPIPFDAFMIWITIHISIQIHGHSGLRLYFPTILTSIFLRPFGLEIATEDHDLHHRHGWRDSYNYGKQSRFWDHWFGTTGERLECTPTNLDMKAWV